MTEHEAYAAATWDGPAAIVDEAIAGRGRRTGTKLHTTLRRVGPPPGDVALVEVSICPLDCPDIEWGDGAYFRVSGTELARIEEPK